ncbi:unnamed protein product [Allacma fusca]|uniref:Uncharacterized protein n=1 Tax=Allacma fusca TaxID=39272 RepID=A0A8J2LRX8_9HEXA|nr:unnamed protein product [Allacma fusca]
MCTLLALKVPLHRADDLEHTFFERLNWTSDACHLLLFGVVHIYWRSIKNLQHPVREKELNGRFGLRLEQKRM